MKKILICGATILLLFLSSHSYYFRKLFLSWFLPENALSYSYSTINGEFRRNETVNWKGGSWTCFEIDSMFNRYKSCFPSTKDTVLYRTFKKEPLQFWNWIAYFSHPCYQLPYIDPKTVPEWASKRLPSIYPGEF